METIHTYQAKSSKMTPQQRTQWECVKPNRSFPIWWVQRIILSQLKKGKLQDVEAYNLMSSLED